MLLVLASAHLRGEMVTCVTSSVFYSLPARSTGNLKLFGALLTWCVSGSVDRPGLGQSRAVCGVTYKVLHKRFGSWFRNLCRQEPGLLERRQASRGDKS